MKTNSKARICLLMLLALLQLSLYAQPMQPLPMDPAVRYGKLENGLTYYIRHNEEPKGLANFYIAQKVGSVQEEEDQRGLAHFLEHMAFNGSEKFPADGQLIKACEAMGVKFGQNLNAYTSTDETVYNIDDVPTANEAFVDTCLWILHDWANGLLLTEPEINKERGVIHEEWRMRSSANQRILNRRLEELYPGSRYGRRMPIGLMEVVDNFAPDFLRAYYKKWYRPDLQGIVIVGDVDVDAVEAKVKAIFGPIPMPANAAAYEEYPVPDNEKAIYVIDKDKELPYGVLFWMYKTTPLPKEARGTVAEMVQDVAVSLMTHVLNERLADLSQREGCPFLQASVGYGTYLLSKTADCLEVDVVPQTGKDAEAVKAVMLELERAYRFGLTASELQRARDELISQVEKVYDNREKQRSAYYVNQCVQHFLTGSNLAPIEVKFEVVKQLAALLDAPTLQQSLQQLLESTEQNFVLLGMYPEKDGVTIPTEEQLRAAIAEARAAEIEAFVDTANNGPLVENKPQPVRIAQETPADFGYTQWTLSNGARVFYKQTDFNQSEVLMAARSKGGVSLLPQEDLLNASLVGSVMNSNGWGTLNSMDLEKALAGKQVSLSIGLSDIGESMSGKSTPKDLRTLFELMYLHFQEVKDDPDAFRTYMDATRLQLENAEKLPMKSFQDSITVALYQRHPRLVDLQLKDLDKVDYAAIKRIYKERFQSVGDFDFFFTGAIPVDSLRMLTEEYLAPLPALQGEREDFKRWNVEIAPGKRDVTYHRAMETPQAYTFQVWSGELPYTLENDVTMNALGSALSQMLLKTIREDAGLSYSVGAEGEAGFGENERYTLQIVIPFKPAQVDSVHLLVQEGIDQVAQKGVEARYIDDFKKFELKQLEDGQRLNSYWQSLILTKMMYGYDRQQGMREAIENLTSEKVQQMVNEVLYKQGNTVNVTMLPQDLTE